MNITLVTCPQNWCISLVFSMNRPITQYISPVFSCILTYPWPLGVHSSVKYVNDETVNYMKW